MSAPLVLGGRVSGRRARRAAVRLHSGNRVPVLRWSIALALPLASLHASAQTTASAASPLLVAADAEDSALAEIVVSGHYDTAVGSTDAASQGSVNGALLDDIPLLRPGEVLETVPGMVVTQHSGDGKANQYFLRGYNLDHGTDFATRIDGVPVNMPTNAHGQGYADLNYLIPELVERIDYLKGPYFAESGDFSAAGSADIQYKRCLEQDVAQVTVGSFGYRRALLAASAPLATAAPDAGRVPGSTAAHPATGDEPTLMGALEVEGYDGPWSVPEGLHKVNGLLRLGAGSAANGWSVDGAVYDAKWNSTDQVPLSLIQSGRLGRFAALDPTDGGDSGRQILSAQWQAHDDLGYTKASVYAQRYRLQLFSDFSFFELRPATGDQFGQWEHRDFFGGDVAHGWNHGIAGRDSITEAGIQIRHDNVHVGLQDTEARVAFATVSDNAVSETAAGAYVQNTTSWTPWLRSLAGLREQAIAMAMTAAVNPQNSGTASAAKALPKLSVILGPWSQTEFFANWGRGFHSNDARGVLDKTDPTTLQPAAAVPALAGALGRELGLRTQAVPGLQSSLALWALDSDSELIYNADSDIGSTSANGASRRRGIEWNNHFSAGGHLLLDADVAWTQARYARQDDNGQRGDAIPNAVGRVARLSATAQALGTWSASIETRLIGSYPLVQDRSLSTPASVVTNLRLRRDLAARSDGAGLGVSLDLLNVFNRAYDDIAYAQDYRVSAASPVVPTGVTVHPGEPRQWRVSLRWRW